MKPNRKSKRHIIIKLFQSSIKEKNLKSILRKKSSALIMEVKSKNDP